MQLRGKALVLGIWLALLVLTGGGTGPPRLLILVLPLTLLPVSIPILLAGLSLGLLPSLLEFWIYGDLIGPTGARLRLLAGIAAGLAAFCLGQQVYHERRLRSRLVTMILPLSLALMTQAALASTRLIPPELQFLNGNHLCAVIMLLLAPTIALKLEARTRAIILVVLCVTGVLAESRWGFTVAFAAFLLLTARERLAGWQQFWAYGAAFLLPIGSYFLISHINLSKAATLKALMPIAWLRPWSGVGPEGLERLSLQHLVALPGRITHAESIGLDWAASLGLPLTIVLLVGLSVLLLGRLSLPDESTRGRMTRSAALVLLMLLAHELLDFSIVSGAVTTLAGFLCGWVLPGSKPAQNRTGSLGRTVISAGLIIGLILSAWSLQALDLERAGRLEVLPERFGRYPHRYHWQKAAATNDRQEKIRQLSLALEKAPGEGLLWLDLGDVLYGENLRQQATQAYKDGFRMVNDASRRRRGAALARLLPPEQTYHVLRPDRFDRKTSLNQVPAMAGAFPELLKRGKAGLAVMRRSELLFKQPELSKRYLHALQRPGLDPDLAISESLRLLRLKPPIQGAGPVFMALVRPRLRSEDERNVLMSLVKEEPAAGCEALGRWSLQRVDELTAQRGQLLKLCGSPGGADLRTLNLLNHIPRPVED